MSMGVSGDPIGVLVIADVGRNVNDTPGRLVTGLIPHPIAALDPELMIVANAVAAEPTDTDRLAGRTAETRAEGEMKDVWDSPVWATSSNFTLPKRCFGARAVINVGLTTTMSRASMPSKRTCVPK